MKSKLLVCLLLFVTGCNKVLKLTNLPTHPVGTTLHNQTILVIGQSNNYRFQTYGESAFVQDYRKTFPSATVQFINCSVGGTSISQWQANGQLFTDCSPIFHGVKPTAILFYQGEADAYLKTLDWDQQFTMAANGWRKILGDIPIIYAQIAVEDPLIYCPQSDWDAIQTQQTRVSIHNAVMIKTADISELDLDPTIAQGVHLSPQSYERIAQRYVDALTTIDDN